MSESSSRNVLRNLPAVDRILGQQAIKDLENEVPHSLIVRAAREILGDMRIRISAGWSPSDEDLSPSVVAVSVRDAAIALNRPSLRRVINATGIILHTGLGRAVLPEAAQKVLADVASGHSNLEIDPETGGRGSRKSHYASLVAELCGAEAAFAVNNNAAAVFLTLNTLARGLEVIISRSQLVEIGGSFRLPDIMTRSGVSLVEVGTTNRTRIGDYEAAIGDCTGMILRVHPSNFRVVGYTQEAALDELVALGQRFGIPVVDDVGSGALVGLSQYGIASDPIVQDSIKAGADLVLFSGDKLLGGPQAGLIVGRRDVVDDLMANPLARALRIGKLTAAALEATLRLYADPDSVSECIPTLRYIARPVSEISRAAEELKRLLDESLPREVCTEILDGVSEVGGGSLPGQSLATRLVSIAANRRDLTNPMDLARSLRLATPPVFGRVGDDRFMLDLRTVEDSEIPLIVDSLVQILHD